MKAVIPAAGEATRLRPRTAEKPKALVEVDGTPILTHCFDQLRAAGIDAFVVIVGYRMNDIIEHYGDDYEGIPITYVHQREQLGLGHAVLQAEPHVRDDLILMNGDNVFRADLATAIEQQLRDDVDVVILVEEVSREEAAGTGVIVSDEEGRVLELLEKPTEPPSTLVNAGCYVLPPEVFHALHLVQPSDRGEYELTDAIDLLVGAGMAVETMPLDGWRVNVNTVDDIERAEAHLQAE